MKKLNLSKIGLFGLATLVLGCGEKSQELTSIKAETSLEEVITVFTWEDYFDVETFAGFEQREGVKVVYETFESTDEMEAKLLSQPGKYDVVIADNAIIEQMWEQRLIRELDHSLLPNLSNIKDAYRNAPYDPGNRVSAPYTWGTTLVAYRADKIDVEDESWDLLWDPNLKGKVSMYKDPFEVLSIPIIANGKSLNTSDEAEVDAAADRLIQQIDEIEVRFAGDLEVKQGLADGTIWAAMCYSGDAAMAAAENENVQFFIPREGAPLWVDSFAVARDSKRSDLAHSFINYMLDAEVAAQNINYICYASPNAAAEEFIDEELLSDASINPPKEVLDRCQWFTKKSAARESLLNEAWLRVHRAYQASKRDAGDAAATAASELVEPQ